MTAFAFRRAPLAVVGAAALLFTGCIGQSVTVAGKVTFPPSANRIESDTAQIAFVPQAASSSGKTIAANIAADGSFVCKDMLPGKYKLVVTCMPYPGGKDQAKRKAVLDRLGKTYDEQHTKLTDEVATASQQITVDLVNGTVTKN